MSKCFVSYEDRSRGRIARVEKHRYIQSGKKVFFELPDKWCRCSSIRVYEYGTCLNPDVDYHIYWGKLFIHKYLPSKTHIYVVITEEQDDGR